MVEGNGAIIVHKILEQHLSNYVVNPYSPSCEYLPFKIRKFSDKHADIIHTTADYGFLHVRKKQRLVVTLHNYVLDQAMKPYSSLMQRIHYKTDLRLFTKLSLERAHVVTAVSQFVADKTKEDIGFRGEILVIPNGIDEKLFFPVLKKVNSKDRIKVLFSGNLSTRKGAQWIIPILEKLDEHIDIIYTSGLRGGEPLLNHPRLHCVGSVNHNEMPKLYQQVDILLFPTVREGFGLAVAEAMSCGLPVVTTNCSALPELVHQGQGGYLCGVGDIDDFSDKINFLADNEVLRRNMGQYNRKQIEDKFTLKKMIVAYQTLFGTINSAQL